MNLINLQRDMTHIPTKNPTALTYGTSTVQGTTVIVNADPTVNTDVGFARVNNASVNNGAGFWQGMGVYMDPARVDSEPYRVKAFLSDLFTEKFVFVGIGPAAPTGGNDVINNCVVFPANKDFDDILLMYSLDSGDADFGKPLCFGVAYGEGVATPHATISVQRMARSTPRYASAVS